MAKRANIDFETRSECDLKRAGADAYAEHLSTEILCMAWALDDDPVQVWEPGDPDPTPLLEHIRAAGAVTAWNSYFEESLWRHVVKRSLPHWPQLKTEQVFDTMAAAYALALPGSLGGCAEAVKLHIQKDKEGNALMLRMCAPRPTWKKSKTGPKWFEDRERRDRLKAYCKKDVEVERELLKRIVPLSARERRIWLLDQTINRRGVMLDVPSIEAAREILKAETSRLNAELYDVTGGAVSAATAPAKLKTWLAISEGIEAENMAKGTVTELLSQDLGSDAARRALEIRLEGGKASTKKVISMLQSACVDHRARGLLGYHVGTTGRWAGRRIQPQNMPKPHELLSEDDIDEIIGLLHLENGADMIRFGYVSPSDAISSCLRGFIISEPGKRFVGGDFSNIEGRVLPWLAGEAWKLDAFRDYDAGTGPDLYCVAVGRAFGVDPWKVEKPQRNSMGKPMELGLGFGGGPAAFLKFMKPGDAPNILAATEKAAGEEFWDFWADMLSYVRTPQQFGALREELTFDQWVALKFLVTAWRDRHSNIKDFWYDLENSAIEAVLNPKRPYSTRTGSIKFIYTGAFLFCQLPSTRCLAYPSPKVIYEVDDITKKSKPSLEYWAWDGIKQRWSPFRSYGGHLSENVTQAVARDLLADAMFRAEAKGYPIVLHVHDELLSEVPNDFGSTEEFQQIMCASEPWAKGLPVAAEPWEGRRYRK